MTIRVSDNQLSQFSMRKIIFLATPLFFFLGCATKSDVRQVVVRTESAEIVRYEPYQFRQKPIIGSRNNDARVAVDMGVVLKIWVAPYKDSANVLTSAHDIYAWARQPDFIAGEELPRKQDVGSGLTQFGRIPPSLAGEEIDKSDFSDENIKDFINFMNKEIANRKIPSENLPAEVKDKEVKADEIKKQSEADAEIMNYIKRGNQ